MARSHVLPGRLARGGYVRKWTGMCHAHGVHLSARAGEIMIDNGSVLAAGIACAVSVALGAGIESAAGGEASVVRRPGQAGPGMVLWYDEPAKRWTDANPIGNGRFGAMIFGRTDKELIQLNEDTIWAGKPHDYAHKGAVTHLPQIRKLLFEGIDLSQQIFDARRTCLAGHGC